MLEAMQRGRGVQTRAAELLGMTFRSFRYFAKKYDLTTGRDVAAALPTVDARDRDAQDPELIGEPN